MRYAKDLFSEFYIKLDKVVKECFNTVNTPVRGYYLSLFTDFIETNKSVTITENTIVNRFSQYFGYQPVEFREKVFNFLYDFYELPETERFYELSETNFFEDGDIRVLEGCYLDELVTQSNE